jgi:hypothetical protein
MDVMLLTLYGGDAVLPANGHTIGPFDDLVIRSTSVVGGAPTGGRVVAFRGSDGRWLEADREEARGVDADPTYARHSHLWLHSAERDLRVRFFAEDKDDRPMRVVGELGPYSAVTIGPREVRGDGDLLADRTSREMPWVRRNSAGPRADGDAVLAVRSDSVAHAVEHPRAAGADARAIAPAVTETTPREFAPEFKFIERVRVSPRIYIARGTAAERDP